MHLLKVDSRVQLFIGGIFNMKKSRLLLLLSAIALVTCLFSMSFVGAATVYGDLNSDSSVDSIDYSIMKGYLFGSVTISNPAAADVNGDGNIDAIDLALMKQYILHIITKFPADNNTTPGDNTPAAQLTGDIVFSAPSCTFSNQVSVSLNSKIAGAQIRYTVDGSVPTASSPAYTSPLSFTRTTQLRAQSFINGTPSGKMGTAIYVSSAIDAKHDLPVLILDAYGGGKPAREYKDVAIMLMEPKNNEVSLLQTPTVATRAGFHVRGQSSANFEKTPYRLELWDNQNEDAKYSLLGMPGDGDWALLSPFPDKSLIRNALAYELGTTMGLKAPRYRFVEVYLNLDNQPLSSADYQGVYLLTETLEIDKDRVNIKKLKDDDLTEPNITGGYLMQFNMMATDGPLVKGSGWNDLEIKDPDDLLPQQLTWISNYIQKVHNSIRSTNPSDPTTGYPAYIDVDSFINYIIENELAREGDSYMRSTYIYKDRGAKLAAGPVWDYDLGYNCVTGMMGMQTNYVEGWQFQPMFGMSSTCDWYYKLMQDSAFQSKISARWQELRNGPLSDTQIKALVQKLTTPLANGAKRNFQKWNNLGTATVGGFSTQTTQTWEEQITILQNFLLQRAAWLDKSGWKPTTNTNPGWPGWGG